MTLTLAAIPLAQAVTDASSASDSRPRVVFRPGTVPDTFRIVPRPRTPLALIVGHLRQRSGVHRGELRHGLLRPHGVAAHGRRERCAGPNAPPGRPARYSVREATVPFPAPRGAWAWSTIVLTGIQADRNRSSPQPPATILSSRQRVRSVVVCVDPQFARTATQGDARDLRADEPTPPASTSQATPTPTNSPVVSLPTASPAEDLPVIPPPGIFAKPNDKITICHATDSASTTRTTFRPSTRTPSPTNDPNGHGTHTGPLFPGPGWGDVIPPFEDYPGMNWPQGSLLLEDGCALAPPDPIGPPGIDIDPPPVVTPPIYLPIEITPPIYLPEPSPSATSTPSATTTPSVSASASSTPTPSTTAIGVIQPHCEQHRAAVANDGSAQHLHHPSAHADGHVHADREPADPSRSRRCGLHAHRWLPHLHRDPVCPIPAHPRRSQPARPLPHRDQRWTHTAPSLLTASWRRRQTGFRRSPSLRAFRQQLLQWSIPRVAWATPPPPFSLPVSPTRWGLTVP